MSIMFLNSGKVRSLSEIKKRKRRKSCILVSCREELYYDVDAARNAREETGETQGKENREWA